jgi:hypothetical protein
VCLYLFVFWGYGFRGVGVDCEPLFQKEMNAKGMKYELNVTRWIYN